MERMIVAQEQRKGQEQSLLHEKQRLFSHILEATGAEPNEVQRAYDLLAVYRVSKRSFPVAIIDVQARLLQPEALILLDQDVRNNLLASSHISQGHPALGRLVTLITDLTRLIRDYPDFASILGPLRNQYEQYVDAFFASTPEERDDHMRAKALISGEGLGDPSKKLTSFRIDQRMAQDLISKDKYNLFKKKNAEGSHAVCFIRTDKGGVHFKGNTTSTGVPVGKEAALYWLSKLLFGRGMAATSLVTLHGVEMKEPAEKSAARGAYSKAIIDGLTATEFFAQQPPDIEKEFMQVFRSHLIQAGDHKEGTSLLGFIQGVQAGTYSYNDIDTASFTEQIVISLSTHPSDATPGNFIVQTSVKPFTLVGIDNDMALGPDIVKMRSSARHYLEEKNFLYCLPLMNRRLSQVVVQRFEALDVDVMLMQWLECLHNQHGAYDILQELTYSSGRDQKPLLAKQEYAEELHLPLRFVPEIISQLRDRLHRIQDFIRKNPSVTHWELFLSMSPLVGRFYQAVLGKYASHGPVEAFIKILHPIQGEDFIEDVLAQQLADDRGLAEQLAQVEETGDISRRQTATIDDVAGQAIKDMPDLFVRLLVQRASLSLIRFLVERGLNPFVMLAGQRTLLHYALEQGSDPSIIQYLIELYKKADKKEFLLERDTNNKTLLDVALERENLDVIKIVIDEGIVQCDPRNAVAMLYKYLKGANRQYNEVFIALIKHNPEVSWMLHSEYFMPEPAAGVGGMSIISNHLGKRIIPAAIQDQISTGRGVFLQRSLSGNHRVCYADHHDELWKYRLYFKIYPELPCTEEAVGSFIRRLFGFGAPYTELVKYNGIPIMLSQGILGETLLWILKNDPKRIDRINQKSLSGLMIGSMLVNPGDGKPDNFVLDDQDWIASVDNDHAFAPAVVREIPKTDIFGKAQAVFQVKTVLYCIDYMKAPVHPEIRERIMNLDIDAFLKEWLEECKDNDAHAKALFHPMERSKLLNSHESYIGFPLQKGAVAHIRDKLEILQELLAANPRITHIQLLSKLEPRLAQRYYGALHERLSVLERFKRVDLPFYGQGSDGSYTTVTRTGQILQSMNIPLKMQAKGFSADDALLELEQASSEARLKDYTQAMSQLRTGWQPKSWALFLRAVDFKTIPPDEQMKILALLKDQGVRELILYNCGALSDKGLEKLNFDNVLKVDLRGTNITGKSIMVLAEKGLFIEELNLGNCKTIDRLGKEKGVLEFSRLKVLNLGGCSNLERAYVRLPSLEYLNIRDCSLLDSQSLENFIQGSKLKKIECSKRSYEHVKSLIEQYGLHDVEILSHDDILEPVPVLDRKPSVKVGGKRPSRGIYQDQASTSSSSIVQAQKPAESVDVEDLFRRGMSLIEARKYKVGIPYLTQAANLGYSKAQFQLALCYDNERGVKYDGEKIFTLLLNAAEQGHFPALTLLVEVCITDKKYEYIYQKLIALLLNVAEGQPFDVLDALIGDIFSRFKKNDSAFESAISLIQESLGNENLFALDWIEKICARAKKQYLAFGIFLKLANERHQYALYKVGWAYDHGNGVEKNPDEAIKCFEKAAKQAEPNALFELANKYSSGEGVPFDILKAIELWQAAADKGHKDARKVLNSAFTKK